MKINKAVKRVKMIDIAEYDIFDYDYSSIGKTEI